MNLFQKSGLALLSLVIVGFGQPAFASWLSIVAAIIGYALFWAVIIDIDNARLRFFAGLAWFSLIQAIQLSWSLSHPYVYIYAVYSLYCIGFGIQFGILCLFITENTIKKLPALFGIAAVWTLLEWSRLFFLSGFTWNPAGLALSGNVFSIQMASIWGVYGLSFWVILVNLFALRAWKANLAKVPVAIWAIAAALPFLYGYYKLGQHEQAFVLHEKQNKPYSVALVQTGFEVEEASGISDRHAMIAHTIEEWGQILAIMRQHKGKDFDLIVLPEGTVPCGTYSFVFPIEYVRAKALSLLGEEVLASLPPLHSPLAQTFDTPQGKITLVNNAYWTQLLANYFDASVIIGLEDVEEDEAGHRSYFSSAFHFQPQKQWDTGSYDEESFYHVFKTERYDKRVLVPMGEYIPFEFCRELAAQYGVNGTYAFGTEPKVFNCAGLPLTLSICYEETFGNLMRESRALGAELIVNLTNDAWFPNSRLPQQHFDHARLRTVESGVPLVRACNTGLTGAVDSLGRQLCTLGDDEHYEWLSDVLHVELPTYTYDTLYSRTGDSLILTVAFLCLPALWFGRFRGKL
ncbi:MAG: apolipoprotein N-acyltransferase [Chlamydiales bacterium]|nr:apolipoprotein N-acyltransferase [Chlamydiia bacterium]MCP5506913.1 apolipoprotein N-acyltransferase [Chlamydiales bacterium]